MLDPIAFHQFKQNPKDVAQKSNKEKKKCVEDFILKLASLSKSKNILDPVNLY